jgi:GT2 family glycosyltransferase
MVASLSRQLQSALLKQAFLAGQAELLDERLQRVEQSQLFRWARSWSHFLARWRGRLPGFANPPASAGPEAYAALLATLPDEPPVEDSGQNSRLLSILEAGSAAPEDLGRMIGECPGPYVLVLAPGSKVCEAELPRFRQSLAQAEADLVYFDDDVLDEDGTRHSPVLRPAWSPALLSHGNYLGGSVCVKRGTVLRMGLRPEFGPAMLYDLALRLSGQGGVFLHWPGILVHRPEAALSASSSERSALQEYWSRRGAPSVRLQPVPGTNSFYLRRTVSSPVPLTAVICTKTPRLAANCLDALSKTAGASVRHVIVICHEGQSPNAGVRAAASRYGAQLLPYRGPFDFAAMNNRAASHVKTEGILFLNDDVYARHSGWADLLGETLTQPEVGAAGALLYYPDGRIQHAGIALSINSGVGHPGRRQRPVDYWPWLPVTREVSAVTGACLAVRRSVFQQIEGFDPEFPVNYNDVDFCLRVRALGASVVCVAAGKIYHVEAQTRTPVVRFFEKKRLFFKWPAHLGSPDPFHHPYLASTEALSLAERNPGRQRLR